MSRELYEEILRRQRVRPTPVQSLFDKQLFVLGDPAREKAICTSRRAGKSHLIAVKLWETAQKYPGSQIPYIALTRDSARRIMWKVFEELFGKYEVRHEPLESKLIYRLPNKSEIFLVGADQKNFVKRLRGAKYPTASIDEMQGFADLLLEELIDEVLTPALADYNGDLWLAGTPGPTPQGFWYETSSGQRSAKPFHWTLFDNPHMPNAKAFVDEMKRKKQWTEDNPTLQREWYGLWVRDLDALVYKFNRERNLYDELPKGFDFERVMAIDFGWNDQTAFGILAYSPNHPKIFIEHIEGHSEMIPSDIAARAKQLQAKFKPLQIVADTGGLGKSITEEMIRMHGLPIEAAKKTEKLAYTRMMNGDFVDRKVLVHRSLKNLHDQYEKLTKADNGLEDPSLPNDLCDVALYGWRACYAYAWQPREKRLDPSTEKFMEEAWEREAEEGLREESEKASQPWLMW